MKTKKKKGTGRAKGTGSIQKKGNSYYFRIKINGKEICRKMKNVSTDKEAELEATRLYTISSAETHEEVALFAGRARKIIRERNEILIHKAFEVYKNSSIRPPANEKTMKQHEYHWKLFLEWLPDNEQTFKNVEDKLDSFFSNIASKKNPRTFNSILKTLKLVFRIVYPVKTNPCLLIHKLNEKTKHHKALSEKEIEKVLSSVDIDYPLSIPHRDEMKALFRVGIYTGMRLIDCCLLEWENIDLINGYIRVVPYKTANSGRRVTIPIHHNLRVCLESLLRKNKYVLPNVADRYNRNPGGVDLSACRIIWYAIGEKPPKGELPTRMKGYGFHSLRHSFVSFCANAGVPLAVVQEIAGHGSMMVTRVYTHFAPDTLREAVNAIPGSNQRTLTDSVKLARIKEILSDKKRFTKAEKAILKLLQ